MASSNSKAAATMGEENGGGGGQTIPPRQRKGFGLRTWLVVSESGESRLEEVGKHSIMRRTGLPARDLRVLDPLLSYPSSILGRERAIVVNIEHIRAIVTAKEVFMLNSTNPLVVQFIDDLKYRLSLSTHQETERDETEMEGKAEPSWGRRRRSSGENTTASENTTQMANCSKVLPFEFRALESCLESACRCLESETQTLEEEAYPALDELTSKISTLNLERVRQIKSRLVAINGRVQKVRDEIEHLLDDDNDMAEMYLTEKLSAFDHTSSREENFSAIKEEDERAEDHNVDNSSDIFNVKPNVDELEMLLEAYFAQLDGILQKLSDMSEYVDDTEDCINIMLDDTQNQLLQMGVMLSAANMILNSGIAVVGLFGMNIHISLFDAPTYRFWQTTLGTVGGCVALYLIAIGWGKKKNLLSV